MNTASIRAEEFRPRDLPDGWIRSPEEDDRSWLTKETELAYYNFRANETFRRNYFLQALERRSLFSRRRSRDQLLAALLKKNYRLLAEPVYQDVLDGKAKQILKDCSLGRLIVAGDNRYLSGDLLDFMAHLPPATPPQDRMQRTFYVSAITNNLPEGSFYAPGAAYNHGDSCTLLRNPHIARNEELQFSLFDPKEEKKQMRRYNLGHLTDVVMVDFSELAAERLGGADYDGDMIKTVADPILNACVRRNNYDLYRFEKHKSLTNQENIPLLMIPAVEPLIRDANDWEARFETVRSTFSSRVGQICNAALDRSIVAYNENSDAEDRQRYQEETELLAILTGPEIDSAKSGVRPDLDEYLKHRKVQRTSFLQYKNLMEQAETRRVWYEPTHRQRLKAFFEKTDWARVDANVERLPYLARQLGRHTPAAKTKPAADSDLFTFAQRPDWKEQLDRDILAQIDGLLRDYAPASPASGPIVRPFAPSGGKRILSASSFSEDRRMPGIPTSCTPRWRPCRRSVWRRVWKRCSGRAGSS